MGHWRIIIMENKRVKTNTSISFHKKLGLRLAHNNCDCREFYPRTVIYIYSQSLNLLSLPRVNRSCTCERNMHVTFPLLVNGSYTREQDLQLTSASPHVNGTIAKGNAIKHEIHVTDLRLAIDPLPPGGGGREFCTLWFLEIAIYKPKNETG